MSAWQLFLSGGPLMWPILVSGILAVAVILERLYYFRRIEKDSRDTLDRIFDQVKRNQIREAVQSCEKCSSPVVNVIRAGILKHDRPRAQIKEALEEASLYETPGLEKNLLLLSTVAHAAPLLGFLGSVTGMTGIFYSVYRANSAAAAVSAADFAAGIWQSLITACAGISVAVVSFVAYNLLAGMMNGIIVEIEKASARLLDSLSE